jgi:hypothetical protein
MKHSHRSRLSPTLLVLATLVTPLLTGESLAAQTASSQEEVKRQAEKKEAPPRRRLRPTDGETSLGSGEQEIRISWEKLEVDSRDYPALEQLQAGETFAYSDGRAIKILTGLDLHFGDVEIRRGNASPDYPGVYSLWLRRTGSGWSLVFNSDADIWGTQRIPENDVAEVPLDYQRASDEAATLTLELTEAGDSEGRLRIAWGTHEWTASFLTP